MRLITGNDARNEVSFNSFNRQGAQEASFSLRSLSRREEEPGDLF